MKLTQFINIPIFIISLLIGILGVYIMNNSDKRKITIFPTPDNIDDILYRDKSGTCFKFKQTQVNCPINQEEISKFHAQ